MKLLWAAFHPHARSRAAGDWQRATACPRPSGSLSGRRRESETAACSPRRGARPRCGPLSSVKLVSRSPRIVRICSSTGHSPKPEAPARRAAVAPRRHRSAMPVVSRYHEAPATATRAMKAGLGSGMDERHGDHRELTAGEHARSVRRPAEEVEASGMASREGGKIVRVVIVQAAQPPGVPVTELESERSHARIDRCLRSGTRPPDLHVAIPRTVPTGPGTSARS